MTYAEPYTEPDSSYSFQHMKSNDPWDMADNYTIQCGCIVAVLTRLSGDYGPEGWVENGSEIGAMKLIDTCSVHTTVGINRCQSF